MRVAAEVTVSILVVAGVLWWMWRLPRRGETGYTWAPLLALGSAWSGLIAAGSGAALWVVTHPDSWLPLVLLILAPGAIAAGIWVFWIYRGTAQPLATVDLQRAQAAVGIFLGLLAAVAGYWYVLSHKTPFTPVGL